MLTKANNTWSTSSCRAEYRCKVIAVGQSLRTCSSDWCSLWQSAHDGDGRLPHLKRLALVGSDSTVAFRMKLRGSGVSLPTHRDQRAAAFPSKCVIILPCCGRLSRLSDIDSVATRALARLVIILRQILVFCSMSP